MVPLESLSAATDAARAAQSLAWLAVIICSTALLLVVVGVFAALWVAKRVDEVDSRVRELEHNHNEIDNRVRDIEHNHKSIKPKKHTAVGE